MIKRPLAATVAITAGLLLAGSGVAVADQGTAEDSPPITVLCTLGICGDIYNDDNNQNLRITRDWPSRNQSNSWVVLRPGESSDDHGVKDADGFYIAPGCRGTVAFVQNVGPGWHRVHDHQDIHLTDIVC
ncbi:hypothetical protein C8D87_104400 [Lentzea atacamensis]|uniref:Secreted protein n=1 Tax=Lentzea atacamensis TaxID=531938 RepID=A0ABX9E825_9PSEU|nr:hypothetical protein [Lentzea atacamensis]RAS65849.1 hypothetical protein C8D87_104400 [Lentzea atacamensis]